MSSITIPRTLAVAAALVAVGGALWLGGRGPNEEPDPAARPHENAAAAPVDAPAPLPAAEPSAPPDDALVAAKIRELQAISETFRNTTFLIAIRDSGFVCNELLRVYGDIDTSAKWIATCTEMRAYTVSVASTGTLRVAPMLQYFDGLWPQPVQREFEPSAVPEPLLDPRPLVPPPRQR
jgi:hypothetical protein